MILLFYVRGVHKNGNETNVQTVAKKFQHGLMFHMSKVAFDVRQNPQYVSAPIKHVVQMSQPTLFEPIVEGTLTLAEQAAPPAKIQHILRLTTGSTARYDVAGILRSAAIKGRQVTTRTGLKRAADFELVQMPEGGDTMPALEYTAWGKNADDLAGRQGQYLALFDLEVKFLAPGKVSIETSWNA